jgi:lipopolysaccharide export system permease protein
MKRFFPSTLSRYLAGVYVVRFLGLFAALLFIAYLFDMVELIRRASKFDDVPLGLVFQMGMFKLPDMGQIILPFAVLFSAMLTFWQLSRRQELIIMRSAGLSVWQFLAPVIGVAMLIGVLQMTVINPVGALLLSRYERMEAVHLNRQKSLVTLSRQGLWLRQPYQDGTVILHAQSIKLPEWVLQNAMALFFSAENQFEKRIDAQTAVLEPGQWNFRTAVINEPRRPPQKYDGLLLGTHLTAGDIEETFSSAETIPFWRIPAFVRTLEATGFDAGMVKIHFQKLLSAPLLFAAMILLAASVSLRPPRARGTALLIVAGVAIGFVVFFTSSFLQALGASGQLPPVLAAWMPALTCLLLGVSAMMTFEDG